MERGQFTRAEPHEFAGLSSIQQESQRARELPGRACLEIDIAIGIRYSRVEMRAESLLARVCSWGVCARMRFARMSLVCGHMERVCDLCVGGRAFALAKCLTSVNTSRLIYNDGGCFSTIVSIPLDSSNSRRFRQT